MTVINLLSDDHWKRLHCFFLVIYFLFPISIKNLTIWMHVCCMCWTFVYSLRQKLISTPSFISLIFYAVHCPSIIWLSFLTNGCWGLCIGSYLVCFCWYTNVMSIGCDGLLNIPVWNLYSHLELYLWFSL